MQSYEFVQWAFSNLGPSTDGGMKRTFLLLISLLTGVLFTSSSLHQVNPKETWAQSILDTLTLERKIAQLIMIEGYSNRDEKYRTELKALIDRYQPGGLMFLQGGPVRQARLTNEVQEIVDIPMLVAQDAEWGLAMRLDSVRALPWPLTVGAATDDSLAYRMGAEIAHQCKRVGVHINFGPVADVNVNPNNPIIGNRSFGESPEHVATLAVLYAQGQQDHGVMACAKHFPGHGDTDQDSHKTLPTVAHDRDELDQVDLRPFQALFDAGIGSVMAAHLNVPALDNSGTPTSLSELVLSELLRKELDFQGLIFTDALNMKGVSARYGTGDLEVKALLAGVDVLLMPGDVPKVISSVAQAVKEGTLSEEELEEKVRRVLEAKYDYGLNDYQPVTLERIYPEVNRVEGQLLEREIFESAVTVLLNDREVLPLKDLSEVKPAYVALGEGAHESFSKRLNSYLEMPSFEIKADATDQEIRTLLEQLKVYDPIVVGVHKNTSKFWSSPKVASGDQQIFQAIAREHQTILDLFVNPYALVNFGQALMADALIVSYQNTPVTQDVSAQIIFGAQKAEGTLPVSPSKAFELGLGVPLGALGRLRYGMPEQEGIDARQLGRVGWIMQEAIDDGAAPGGQILIAKNGRIVYDEQFGYQTYGKKVPVDQSTMYDLASITKIAATVPAVMHLYERNKLDIDGELGDYLEGAKGTNKEDLHFREVLAHQARLKPWIPFYRETLVEEGQRRPELFSDTRSETYPWQVAADVYLRYDYPDSVYRRIYESELLSKSEYRYSDLGYYLIKKIVEDGLDQNLDTWVKESIYKPLGATSLGYRPLTFAESDRIAPTSDDQTFRGQLLRGYVHDPGAALTDGVNGHAGVFGSATDVAKLMQMFLNKGEYGGHRFFKSTTLDLFTSCQFCEDDNRRGIGFDKPKPDGDGGPTCNCVSLLSFGHTGFTGTLAWADPDQQVIYIFLSNRVHPDETNQKLISMDVRTDIQEQIYQSLYTYPETLDFYEN